MPKPIQHTRICRLPVPESICAGQLDSFHTIESKRGLNLILEYHARVPAQPIEIFRRDGELLEHSRGIYRPRCLLFTGIEGLEISGLYQDLDRLPPDHPARIIVDMYDWVSGGNALNFFLLFGRSVEDAEIRFFARGVKGKDRTGNPIPFEHKRDWSPAPAMSARIVPQPRAFHQHFGGDPVTFLINGKKYHHRLFVGGLDIQPGERPQVGAVLNLGECPSTWAGHKPLPEADRWVNIGEGSRGMSPEVLRREAMWVIEHLQCGKRVLVHCAAGVNRSVTVCCGVLIILEGLSAEDALERVRQHHPWARPDGRHWLVLKWLAANLSTSMD